MKISCILTFHCPLHPGHYLCPLCCPCFRIGHLLQLPHSLWPLAEWADHRPHVYLGDEESARKKTHLLWNFLLHSCQHGLLLLCQQEASKLKLMMGRLYKNRGGEGIGAGRTGVIIEKLMPWTSRPEKKTEKIDGERALLTWVKSGQGACARLSESMTSVTSKMGLFAF